MLFCVVNMKQEILFDNVNIWIIFITDKAHSVNTGYIEYDSHSKWLSGRFCAVVKTSNTVSQGCFEKLGYLKSFKEDMVYYVKDI